MSSSTLRRPARTYGRGKESPASRAFDELISNKPAPIKAASTSTKWGQTNFIAVRESSRKKSASSASSTNSSPRRPAVPKPSTSEDIFSFDEESPRKGRNVTRSVAKATSKLPATRIQVQAEPEEPVPVPAPPQKEETPPEPEKKDEIKDEDSDDEVQFNFSVQKTTKTYSRQTAVVNRHSYPRTPSIIKQEQPIVIASCSSSSDTPVLVPEPSSVDTELKSEHDAFGFSSLDSNSNSSCNDVKDVKPFPDTVAGQQYVEDRTMPGWNSYSIPKRIRNSKYNNPKLLENFKKMWDQDQRSKKRSDVGSFVHSNVVSKSQFVSGDKTTMVVVCKPKVVTKSEGDVQTKYFGQPGREFPRGYKPNVVVGASDESDSPIKSSQSSESDYPQSSPSVAPSQDDSYLPHEISTPLQSDEVLDISTRSKPIPASLLKPVIPGNRIFKSRKPRNEPVESSPVEASTPSEDNSMDVSSQESASVPAPVKPARSGYRIFKSRAPKSPKKEPQPAIVEEENKTFEEPPVLSREDTLPMETSDNDSQSVDKNNIQTLQRMEESDVDSQDNVSVDSRDVVSVDNVDSPSSDAQPTATKERKIFKTRNAKKTTSSLQKSPSKAIYNARSWQNDDLSPEAQGTISLTKGTQKRKIADEDILELPSVKMKRKVHWPGDEGQEAFTSLKVDKEHKQLFTVVRNVKESFEMQESGETQEFMDDVEYLLDSLKNTEPVSIRCISCIQIAQKCKLPAFRMHLRAHGTVTRIFTMLHDACTDPSLSLCTATIMFMLSQDRLNMDLDTESLNLMLRLLEVDSDKDREIQYDISTLRELEKNKTKIKDLCEQLQKAGLAKTLDLDCLTTGNLAMESLLSLTSRRAGEWFKEELRSQGALDHIVDTIAECSKCAENVLLSEFNKSLPVLKKLDRCLRVLENITYMNTDNQDYLLSYNQALVTNALCGALKGCVGCLPSYPVTEDPEENKEVKESIGWVVFNCMLAVLRVLLNLTHDNELGSQKVGEQDQVINTILECILSTTQYIPQEQKFDLLVLSLGLLINLVEYSEMNRLILIESEVSVLLDDATVVKTGINCLVELFCEREEAARQMEDKEEEEGRSPVKQEVETGHNKSGEWEETETGVQWIVKSAEAIKKANEEKKDDVKAEDASTSSNNNTNNEPSPLDDDETFTKALHKAGKHMENSIVASYVALLLGCLIRDNQDFVDTVRVFLPNESFESMIKTLKKFLGFMNLTIAIGNTGGKSIAKVIEVLEAC